MGIKKIDENIRNKANKGLLMKEEPVSIGNEGVVERLSDCRKKDAIIIDVNEKIDSLKRIFNSLTDQEMRIFTTIYRIGQEFSRAVLYREIAKEMHLSQSSVRDHISELISKEAPIYKEKTRNNRVLVGIKKEFYDLQIASKLVNLTF